MRSAALAISDCFVACQSRGPARSMSMSRATSAARMDAFSERLDNNSGLLVTIHLIPVGMKRTETWRPIGEIAARVAARLRARCVETPAASKELERPTGTGRADDASAADGQTERFGEKGGPTVRGRIDGRPGAAHRTGEDGGGAHGYLPAERMT